MKVYPLSAQLVNVIENIDEEKIDEIEDELKTQLENGIEEVIDVFTEIGTELEREVKIEVEREKRKLQIELIDNNKSDRLFDKIIVDRLVFDRILPIQVESIIPTTPLSESGDQQSEREDQQSEREDQSEYSYELLFLIVLFVSSANISPLLVISFYEWKAELICSIFITLFFIMFGFFTRLYERRDQTSIIIRSGFSLFFIIDIINSSLLLYRLVTENTRLYYSFLIYSIFLFLFYSPLFLCKWTISRKN